MDMMARAAFIIAQSACCQAKLAAMAMQNTIDLQGGRPVTFQPSQFEGVGDEFRLGHNAVLEYLR